jgi:hypothetical protein
MAQTLSELILELITQVPAATTQPHAHPRAASERVARAAATKAALAAGSLALPTGPLGWLTVVPELAAVWRIQAQMVADIAALHGASHAPTREDMLHCLFRHAAAQALRDLGVRVGERLLVQEASVQVLQRVSRAVGWHLSQRALGSAASRWVPLLGAVGVGSYAWMDTRQVAQTAIEWFSRPAVAPEPTPPLPWVERLT